MQRRLLLGLVTTAIVIAAIYGYSYLTKNKIPSRCTVYYASQTGRAQGFASILTRRLVKCFNIQKEPINIEVRANTIRFHSQHFDPQDFLDPNHLVILLISTCDQGAVPDAAKAFVKWLKQSFKQRIQLPVAHAIFGLGSSEYEQFNQAAKDVGKLLLKLGSQEALPMHLGNEMVNLQEDFTSWNGKLLEFLCKQWNINVHAAQDEACLKPPPIKPKDSWRSLVPLELRYSGILEPYMQPVAIDVVTKQQWQCCDYTVIQNIQLTNDDDDGPTHCLVLHAIEPYEPAETANVLYENPPEAVRF
ncbi:bifunctional Flavodoxin-nitric oxide synthase/Flavoprotein-like superfamily/Flavodoxin-like [Babesia duncani]|uniref:Bifunctional Flavodoxin-nitric oxide synthase/Flavoprotein-like superfamily/Flavodoxin-like n=1 Tax=Babesia duncani TaxID=323732 RepID=A0AAD9UQ65_9APIC|nr:bifunctional Flavodoxin-nitric oxide synthase/Flavoprotein-like superfamily/Flavodoxin-like [Babesia duncani]